MKFVIILWMSCKLAFTSLWDYRAQVSNARPALLACPPPMQGTQRSGEGKGNLEDPVETRYLLGKLCPCLVIITGPPAPCDRRPLALYNSSAGALVRQDGQSLGLIPTILSSLPLSIGHCPP